MSRLTRFLNEFSSTKDFGTLVAVDIDETIFRTFAKIGVVKDGKIIKKLDNQTFNTYKLQDGESFEFGEFRNAAMFNKTSIPIPKTVKRIKRMLSGLMKENPDIILLTARADFDDKEMFLDTFRKHGIPIDKMYVERTGNITTGTTAGRKKDVLMKYILKGRYTSVYLLDDDIRNIKVFTDMGKDLPQKAYDAVRRYNNLPKDEMVTIHFHSLLVKDDGSIKRVT